jgi:sulfite reductase beta subunit-like hemoprotein
MNIFLFFKKKLPSRAGLASPRMPTHLTPNSQVIIKNVPPSLKGELEQCMRDHGVLAVEEIDPLTRLSIACPAMPMCGLAITEVHSLTIFCLKICLKARARKPLRAHWRFSFVSRFQVFFLNF